MRGRANGWLCLGGLLLLLGGCQRLHYEKTFTLESARVWTFGVDAPSSEQKVEVKVTATEPVSVYVVLEKELQIAEKQGLFDKSKALASKKKVTNETLQATVPAHSVYGVVVMDATKKSEVKIVLDGR